MEDLGEREQTKGERRKSESVERNENKIDFKKVRVKEHFVQTH